MTETVQIQTEYPHEPALVWAAMTDPEMLKLWFEEADLQPVVGHRFRAGGKKARVIEAVAERLIAFEWWDDDEGTSSVVVWRLDPTDGGTRVTVEHRKVETPEVVCLSNDWNYQMGQLMMLLNAMQWLGYRVVVMA